MTVAWLKTDCRLSWKCSSVKRLFNTAHHVLTNRILFCWYLNKKKSKQLRYSTEVSLKKNKSSNHGLMYWCWLNNPVWDYCKAEDICTPLLLFILKKTRRLSPVQAHYFQKDTSITSLLPAELASTLPANLRTPPALSLTWKKVWSLRAQSICPPWMKEFTPHCFDSFPLFCSKCVNSDHSTSNQIWP